MEKIDFGSFVFILHDGVSNDSKGGDAEDIDADVTDETETTDTIQDDANKVATESEIDADGELNTRAGVLKVKTYAVTATANYPEGTFPIGTKMQVVRVKKPSELKTLKTKVDAALESENNGKIAKSIYAYDISFLYDGEKIEPLNPVDISLSFNKSQGKPKATKAEDPEKAEWKMFHATEDGEIAEKTDAAENASEETRENESVGYSEFADSNNASEDTETTTENNTTDLVTENSVLHDITEDAEVSTDSDNKVVHKIDFSSDSFSVYVLAYTVDFHYGDYTWSMEGEQSVLLSELFKILGIEKDVKDVENVNFSNNNLVSVEDFVTDEGIHDWKLTSLQPFTSDETLTIYFSDKTIISIKVTDEQEGSKPTLQGIYYTDSYEDWGTGYWRKLESNQKVTSNFYFRIQYGYSIPAGTLNNSDTGNVITYKLDKKYEALFKNGNYPALENGVIKDDQGKDAGTYEVINGVARLSFNDEYVEKNTNSELKGMFSYTFAFADILTGTEKTITLPYADELNIKNITKKADLTVLKEGTSDQSNETATYTITVSSKNGTFGDIVLTDTSSEIHIEQKGPFTIKKGDQELKLNNKRKAMDQGSFKLSRNQDLHGYTLTLPPLAAGESYKITYSATLDKKGQNYSSATATNTVYGTTNDEDDKELKTDPYKVDLVFNKTSIGKYASSADNGESILWTITIKNDSEQDLKGWTLTDAYKLNDTSLALTENDIFDVKIEPSVSGFGENSIINGFTFPKNSTSKEYKITYKTKINGELGKNHYHNDAILTPSGNNGKSQEAGSDIDIEEYNPLHKEGTGIDANSDGNTAITHWKVTVNADKGDISSNWVLTDVLKDNQYFTDAQLNSLKNALDQLNRSYSLKVSNNGSSDMIDYSKCGTNQKYNAYQITFRDSLEKGSSFSYSYTATAPLDGTGRQEFHNNANINQKVDSEGTNKYRNGNPTITKLDGRNDTKQDTSYEVKSSDFTKNVSWNDGETTGSSNHILKWKIKVYLNEFDDSDLQVVEHIPDNLILREVNFVTESNHGRGTAYLKVNGGDANYSTYTIHTDRSGKDLTITFPRAFLENETKIGTEKLKMEISAEVDPNILKDLTNWDKSDGKNIYSKLFDNQVELKENNTIIDTSEQKQTVIIDNDSDVIKKSITSKAENNRYKDNTIDYEIKINPNALDLLPGADTLTLIDQMDTHYYPNQGQVNAYTLINLQFFRLNADGSKGEPLNCPYQISSNIVTNGNDYQYIGTFKATIPDETPILVTYSYKIDSTMLNSAQDWIQPLHNKVWLEGTVVDYSKESYSSGFNYVQGAATVEAEGVTLLKVNAENYGETISGTSFDLFKYDPSSNGNEKYKKIESYTTDSDGMIRLDSLTKNWGYKLVETRASSGYILSDEPIYFYVLSADTTAYPKNIEENRSYKIYSGGDRIYIENKLKDIPIVLKKVGKLSKSPLSGACFKLYGEDGSTEVSGINLKESGSNGLITDAKGIVLKPGTYYLQETYAPNGYDLPKGMFKLVVSRKEVDVYDFAEGEDPYPESGKHVFIPSDDIVTVEIENTAGIELPATGSMGTTWIYLLGSIIILLAIEFWLIKHKEVSRK
ncbi:MAG: SpaA isopeptide-forming pilin-related protein [Oribacterium sp.]|nr:SpaA isopeptide-forming pilin-related protein [Oribacterium sp.]